MSGTRLFFFCSVLWSSGFTAIAQDGTGAVSVTGRVRDYDTGVPLTGVTVEARDSLLANVITTTSADSGKYALQLPSGRAFVLVFSKAGHVAKSVIMDARDVPPGQAGEEMVIDITLLEQLEGVDYAVMGHPIGRCAYSATERAIVWDIAYTQALRSAIRSTTDAHQAARSKAKPPAQR